MRLSVKLGALALVGALALGGCGTSPSEQSAEQPTEEQQAEESSFQTVDATAGPDEDVTFETANVLTFENVARDDESMDDASTFTFNVSNPTENDIDSFSVDFVYRDAEGNSLCSDSRINDFGIAPETYTVMKTYSWLDEGQTKDQISEVQVTSYDYQMDGIVYEVDLSTQDFRTYNYNAPNSVDFDAANIVSFEYEDLGNNSSGFRQVAVRALNNGGTLISEVSIDMAYFNAEGSLIATDGRFNDDTMNPGNYVSLNSFMMEEEYSSDVASFGIYAYDYKLAEDDANGNNYYTVNLKTGEATGTHIDY